MFYIILMWLFNFLVPKKSNNDITSHNIIPNIQSLQDIKTNVINKTAQVLSDKCIIVFSKDINKPIPKFWLHLHFSMENYITKDELKALIRKNAPEWEWTAYSRNNEIQEKVLDKTANNIKDAFREKGYKVQTWRQNKWRPAIVITD